MGETAETEREVIRLFISAGEQSGDRIGAAFIRAFRSISPEAEFLGIGGERMRGEGMEMVRDLAGHDAMWFLKSLSLIPKMYRLLQDCRRHLDRARPDGVVVIDYPGFNFYITREAKRRGIPSIYYVTPQIWAYNPYRAVKLRKDIDQALVIFPFEEKFLLERGVAAKYVGHPLMDDLISEWGDDLPPTEADDAPVLGVLPGSRMQELLAGLPHIVGAARRIRESVPDLKILASASQKNLRPPLEAALGETGIPSEILDGQTGQVLRRSRLSLVTSGTTTLEGVFHGAPMLVLYRIPPVSYWASRPWRLVPHIALPNILAGREVVPEFVLWSDRDSTFIEAAARTFGDREARSVIRAGLGEVRSMLLERRDASLAAARAVLDLVGQKKIASSP